MHGYRLKRSEVTFVQKLFLPCNIEAIPAHLFELLKRRRIFLIICDNTSDNLPQFIK